MSTLQSDPAPTSPRLDKNALVGIWIETSLWGMNCIIYLIAMFVLLKKLNKPWVLATTSTILFILGCIHIALALGQLLEGFIELPQPAILYWEDYTNYKAGGKIVIYVITVLVQDLVLIWRLYVVWGRRWIVVVLPLMIEVAHTGISLTAAVFLSFPSTIPRATALGPDGWALDLVLNIGVTGAIVGRIWYMGRKVEGLSSSSGKYFGTIFTIIESGSIFAACTLAMAILYKRGSPLAFNGLDISTQVAVMTPLFIIVRVGTGMVHGLPSFNLPRPRQRGVSAAISMQHLSMGDSQSTESHIVIRNHQETISERDYSVPEPKKMDLEM